MIQITDTIQFDESKLLSKQTSEFQRWYNENVNPLINDKTPIDSFDEFKRPQSYAIVVGELLVDVWPQYIFPDSSNWSCSDFEILIQSNI